MYAETQRLIIRDLEPEDLPGLLAVSSDPDTVRMMDAYLPPDEAELQAWLVEAIWHNQQLLRSAHNCAISLKASRDIIGCIGFGTPSDLAEGDLSFGYALNRVHRDKGYMTEAVIAMLTFCFDVVGAKTVSASYKRINSASGRVMQKAGMHPFDAMMQARTDDEVYYIITADDWRARTSHGGSQADG